VVCDEAHGQCLYHSNITLRYLHCTSDIIVSAEDRDVTQLHVFLLVLSLWAMLTSRRHVDLKDYTEAHTMD